MCCLAVISAFIFQSQQFERVPHSMYRYKLVIEINQVVMIVMVVDGCGLLSKFGQVPHPNMEDIVKSFSFEVFLLSAVTASAE